jgi:hypothetical protein
MLWRRVPVVVKDVAGLVPGAQRVRMLLANTWITAMALNRAYKGLGVASPFFVLLCEGYVPLLLLLQLLLSPIVPVLIVSPQPSQAPTRAVAVAMPSSTTCVTLTCWCMWWMPAVQLTVRAQGQHREREQTHDRKCCECGCCCCCTIYFLLCLVLSCLLLVCQLQQ